MMESTKGMALYLRLHAKEQMEKKGFKLERVEMMFSDYENNHVSPNKKYHGQFRICGDGICLVGQPFGDTFHVFTMYEDGVMTPPRPDQLETPDGQKYAKSYEKAIAGGSVKRSNEYWPRVHERNGDIRHKRIK
jgi:hypothetical protein